MAYLITTVFKADFCFPFHNTLIVISTNECSNNSLNINNSFR